MRSPYNSRQKSKGLARGEVRASSQAIRGFLAEDWDGRSQNVKVRLNSSGTPAVMARSAVAGKLYSVVPEGTLCGLRMNRGTLELISVDTTQQGDILSTALRACQLGRVATQTIASGGNVNMGWTQINRNDFVDYNPKIAQVALPSGGTVAKGVGSTTITGTSTRFLDDLSPGDTIVIPGGASEYFSVVSIASQTSMTVTPAAANAASGQTCSYSHQGVSVPFTGWYFLDARVSLGGSNAGTDRSLNILRNGLTLTRMRDTPNFTVHYLQVTAFHYLAQYDLLEVTVLQNSGVNMTTDLVGEGFPSFTLATMAGL